MSDQSIAVVGGAGFIGSHLVDSLAADGLAVMVIDDLSHPCGVELPQGVELVEADGGSPEAASALTRFRPWALVHLAAKGGVNRALRDPGEHVRRVLASSVACFESAARAGCEAVVIASSGGAVYGDPERLPASEEMAPAPRSAYGAEKLCEETYLWTLRRRGVRTVALRYGNVFGPRQDGTGEAGVVAISATRLAAGLRPVIFGDGSQSRDFVYVADIVAATRAALAARVNGPVNVGTGRETSVTEIVTGLIVAARASVEPEHAPPRPGEVARACLDPSRAWRWLGWKPHTSLEEGLAQTYEHFAARAAGASAARSAGTVTGR
ncbi:MAG TPA: NAD-dependent epimerase/dehydratase family protein [Candidatus Binatia bacterium]|nr:NAD-dependent epimerase/dehydratase family protein [Candidatus Binatia bacterium]